jgi:hypothetical protein
MASLFSLCCVHPRLFCERFATLWMATDKRGHDAGGGYSMSAERAVRNPHKRFALDYAVAVP